MTAQAIKDVTFADLLLPAALLVGLSALVLVQTGVVTVGPGDRTALGPETVTVEARPYDHRMPGDFQMNGAPVNGILLHTAMEPVEVIPPSAFRAILRPSSCAPGATPSNPSTPCRRNPAAMPATCDPCPALSNTRWSTGVPLLSARFTATPIGGAFDRDHPNHSRATR